MVVYVTFALPFVTGSDVRLRKRGDELFITVGNFKREMILPAVLAKLKADAGTLSEGILEIDFLPAEPEPVEELQIKVVTLTHLSLTQHNT